MYALTRCLKRRSAGLILSERQRQTLTLTILTPMMHLEMQRPHWQLFDRVDAHEETTRR